MALNRAKRHYKLFWKSLGQRHPRLSEITAYQVKSPCDPLLSPQIRLDHLAQVKQVMFQIALTYRWDDSVILQRYKLILNKHTSMQTHKPHFKHVACNVTKNLVKKKVGYQTQRNSYIHYDQFFNPFKTEAVIIQKPVH